MGPFVPITIAFAVGILLASVSAMPSMPLLVLAGGLGGLAAVSRQPRAAVTGVLVLWVALGALRAEVWRRHPDHALRAMLPAEPEAVAVHGIVETDPAGVLDPHEAGRQACAIRIRHVRRGGVWEPATGRVRAVVHHREALAYGDELLLEGVWSRVPPPGNPGQYDWRAALARERIHGLLRVRPHDGIARLRLDQAPWWSRMILRVRTRWVELITRHASDRHAGLLVSVLLGQRTALDEDLKQAFTDTGTVHLLVISGFNVGLVAWLIELAGRWTGLGWRLRLAVCAAGTAAYCAITGAAPPVVRAMLMAWMVLGAMALDRVVHWPNTLAAAALAMLWLAPMQVFDAGFQLSVGAVASLIAFSGPWALALEPRLARVPGQRLRRYAALSLAATAAVWAGLMPVLPWYFHLVAPVSMLANLVLSPLMSALVLLGTLLLGLASVWEPVMAGGIRGLEWLVEATRIAVQACHRIPGGYWHVAAPSAAWVAAYYALLTGTYAMRRRWPGRRIALVWGAALGCWAIGAALWRVCATEALTVTVLDVGHGDAIVVRAPNGRVMVVDAGSEEAGRFRVVPCLRAQGTGTVDALVLTHPDGDHIGGAIPLLRAVTVRRLLTNGTQDATMTFSRVRAAAAQRRVAHQVVRAGDRIELDPRIDIRVLHPPRRLVPDVPPGSNDNSVVLRVAWGPSAVLLTGDLEEAGIPWLLSQPGLASGVLKVPHHGSRLGQAGERLLARVRPSLAVISAGSLHRLPARETLEQLRAAGAGVRITREAGAITLRMDGHTLTMTTFASTPSR